MIKIKFNEFKLPKLKLNFMILNGLHYSIGIIK